MSNDDFVYIRKQVDRLVEVMATNTASLRDHMRRTEALEQLVELNRAGLSDRMTTLEKFRERTIGAGWLLGVASSAAMALRALGVLHL